MREVDKISRKIAEVNPAAKIIFGISKNAKLKTKIKTTLLMTGAGIQTLPDAPKKPLIHKAKAAVAKPVKPKVKLKEGPGKTPKEKPVDQAKNKRPKKRPTEKKEVIEPVIPAFEPLGLADLVGAGTTNVRIIDADAEHKKAIRRSALEIRKEEELKERRKTDQEKEWEIPAFLRLKK